MSTRADPLRCGGGVALWRCSSCLGFRRRSGRWRRRRGGSVHHGDAVRGKKIAPEKACKPGLTTRRVFSNLSASSASRAAVSGGGFVILGGIGGSVRRE